MKIGYCYRNIQCKMDAYSGVDRSESAWSTDQPE